MKLKPTTAFGTENGQLTFESKRLSIEASQKPAAQFGFGEIYLVFLPGDLYEGELFHLLLLNAQRKLVEQHSIPLGESDKASSAPAVSIRNDRSLLVESGASSNWILEISEKRRFQPLEIYRRIKQGWLPVFELPGLWRGSFLSAVRRTSL